MRERAFGRIIGIDYSGAKTAVDRLPGLAVYRVEGEGPPHRVGPRPVGAHNWTRTELAHWLVEQLQGDGGPTLVGIDHAFSFPLPYFETYLPNAEDWDAFLDDFCQYWPTHEAGARVTAIRHGIGVGRTGQTDWRRLTEQISGTAKSVFQFGVQGSVAHSTHAGIPWLRYMRAELQEARVEVHFWPFDGWEVARGASVVAEVYPALWNGRFERMEMTPHEHDAYSVAGLLSLADQEDWLPQYFTPDLTEEQCARGMMEGWILGVPGFIRLGVGAEVRA